MYGTINNFIGEVPTLHNVETFGSFLGEEIVANWRRSLERTMVSQARPTPPPALWPPHYEGAFPLCE